MNASARSLLLLVVVLGASAAHGKECKGVNYPDQVEVDGTQLSLNGLGIRKATALKINVYVAALYVARTAKDPNMLIKTDAPSQLALTMLRDVGADDLQDAWTDGFEKNAKSQLPALKERINQLNGWMGDVKKGERLSFTYKPGAGLQVEVNGAVKGTIKGEDFNKAFHSIWLGAEPPNPELKAGLLGGSCG
jgi:hypothetical protein